MEYEKKFGEPIVVLHHIVKEYSLSGRTEVVRALHDIHLTNEGPFNSIKRGEFVMLRGPSGGGKTTLLNLLGTIDKPTSGTLELFGSKIDKTSSDSYLAKLRLEKNWFCFSNF